jgi:ubiquinone/menaquinone biosynthesis C-methylase UbiE
MSYVRETQEFFEARAPGWETRFPDDDPLFEAAIRELNIPTGATVLDAGCGTGRALPFLRASVGETGKVVGADVTPGMIAQAKQRGRAELAQLLVTDVMLLSFAGSQFDVVLAAGVIPHLVDPRAGLAEMARVTRPGGLLAIFHPIGRATLAARHGRTPSEDDTLAARQLGPMLATSGWSLKSIDDSLERYLAIAIRQHSL